jgi:Tfp pilus assembly protein PilV
MKIVFRHLLFPTTLLLILLLLGLALVPGRAFAATKQAQQQTRATIVFRCEPETWAASVLL